MVSLKNTVESIDLCKCYECTELDEALCHDRISIKVSASIVRISASIAADGQFSDTKRSVAKQSEVCRR